MASASQSSANGKSAQISFLVQQLKDNVITKDQLFEKLQRLQRGETVVPLNGTASSTVANGQFSDTELSPAKVSATSTKVASGTQVRSPQPDSVLLQSKPVYDVDNSHVQFDSSVQLNRSASSHAQANASAQGLTLQAYLEQQQALMQAAMQLQASARQAGLPVPPILPVANVRVLPQGQDQQPVDATRRSLGGQRQGSKAPASAQRSGSKSGTQDATSGSPAAANPQYASNGAVMSTRRAASSTRKSLVGRGDLEECTFRPVIHPAPGSSSGRGRADGVPLPERTMAWSMAKREENKRRAEEAARKEQAECTFRPQINASSRDVTMRRPGAGLEVHERLYSQAKPAAPPVPPGQLGGSPSRRLDYSSSGLSPEEQAMLAECTFKPKVNAQDGAVPIKSRYLESADGRRGSRSRPPPLPSGMEEATFRPRTNPVRQESMPAATQYVQAPVHERLARTATKSQVEREKAVAIDMVRLQNERAADEGGLGDSGALAWEGEEGVGGHRRAGSVGAQSQSGRQLTPEEREEKRRQLAEFLARQQEAIERKRENVEKMRAETAPTGQPALCEKSLQLVESRGLGGFLDRLTKGGLTKEGDMLKTKARMAVDPECTFQPAINPSSRSMAPRSVEELSRGDALKRETAVRMLRLRAEQEGLEGITFTPHINARSRRASEGRLRVLSDPEGYIHRVQREAHMQAERARKAAAEAEQAELRECTFRPSTHDAPDYVKRIAQSMALARAVKAPQAPMARPEWR